MTLSAPMSNAFVRLELLSEVHRESLRVPSVEEALWTWMPARGSGASFDTYWDTIAEEASAGEIIPFAVINPEDESFVGVTAFLAISKLHRRLEIGHTLYMRSVQGTAINLATKLLLLERAFDWGALRVEFRTDGWNERSRAAIAKLGAKEEGILRSNTRMVDGTRGDTVCFSILKDEWPHVKDALKARLRSFETLAST